MPKKLCHGVQATRLTHDGDSAIELSPANYGKGEWWLLLDPVLE